MSSRLVDRDPLLALAILEADAGLPLALEVALLGGDAFGRTEERVAAEILVAVLQEAEARFVPDEPVVV